MRKDLHIGLAIGGVLLAVLIVWGVVVGGSKKHKNDVTLQTTGTATGGDIPAPTPVAPAPADSNANIVLPPPIVANVPQQVIDTPAAPAADKKDTDWVGLLAGNTPAPAAADIKKNDTAQQIAPLVTTVQPPSQQIPAPETDVTTTPPVGAGSSAPDIAKPVQVDAPTTATPGARTHKIARGETFASISKAVYGDARYYDQIAQANPKVNPNRLRPGTVINLPDAAEVKSSSKSVAKPAAGTTSDASKKPAAPAVDAQKEYRVVAGDSLYKISMHLYGSGEEADHLYEMNKDKIGPDRGKLKLGAILKIPSPPTAVARAS